MLRAPADCLVAHRRRAHGGFSLFELLVVLAIIATLGVITFGIVQGVRRHAATARARGELAALSQALEQYRRQLGDYPQTADSPERFYQALAGRLGPTGTALHGRSYLEGLSLSLKDPDHPDFSANYLVDPWGRAYQYVYYTRQSGAAPLQRGYVLYSCGPREPAEAAPTRAEVVALTSGAQGGAISQSALNAKNIYAGQ
jgi:general secretion pathway protein G